jgi:hypothetical protein
MPGVSMPLVAGWRPGGYLSTRHLSWIFKPCSVKGWVMDRRVILDSAGAYWIFHAALVSFRRSLRRRVLFDFQIYQTHGDWWPAFERHHRSAGFTGRPAFSQPMRSLSTGLPSSRRRRFGERGVGRVSGCCGQSVSGRRGSGHWRDLPAEFGPWQTIYEYYRQWARDGLWDRSTAAVLCSPGGFRAGSRRPGAQFSWPTSDCCRPLNR